MLKHYKITFTEDRQTSKTIVIPAKSLIDAYIEIQLRFINAEITEVVEGGEVNNGWLQSIAKFMIAHASLDEACEFASNLDAEKQEQFATTVWNEWHKANCPRGAK